MPARLHPGTYGHIRRRELPDGQWQARARYRDFDGVTRIVSRKAATGGAAERLLKAALVKRAAPAGVGVTAETRLTTLADAWLDAPHDWTTGTRQTYGYIVKNEIKPALGGLTIHEVRPSVISRALREIDHRHGSSAAKSARACLSGMFGYAIEHDAITTNPVRDSSARISVKPKAPRALTTEEQQQLTDWLRADERAVTLDLPDLVEYMLGTGARIGEVCAARYLPNRDGEPLIDLNAGTWEIDGTVIRVRGKGLIVQDKPKTKAGWRRIALPTYAVHMLTARQTQLRLRAPIPVVFPAPLARSLRDPSNTSGDLREALDRAGLTWVTSHVFRKTVATRMEAGGCSPREVADQLGHSKVSTTIDVYFGRHVVSSKAAELLDR